MRLLKRRIDRDGNGFVRLVPEEPEDLWHVYQLLSPGDRLRGHTIRKVASETATGTVVNERHHLHVTISMEKIDYEAQNGVIRVNGKNVEENQHIKLGQYQTIELAVDRQFDLFKDEWDSLHLERIKMSCDFSNRADVACCVMNEGLANICLLSSHMTVLRQHIETSIPKKRKAGNEVVEKAVTRFFNAIYRGILQHVDFTVVKCCLIASPGFLKDDFFKYMIDEAQKNEERTILDHRDRFLLAHCSSGHKHAVRELLTDRVVQERLQDTKAASEVLALRSFFEMMGSNPDRAVYGPHHCFLADERLAIEMLLVTDDLFRALQPDVRRRYIQLVESVRSSGGAVHVFSKMHTSGHQLAQLSGVAAILRFPCPDIIDEEEDENAEDDDGWCLDESDDYDSEEERSLRASHSSSSF